MICNICNHEIVIISRPSAERCYRMIDQKSCGCGLSVDVRPVYDLDKCVSGFPLPGFDRESVRDRLFSIGMLKP